MGYENNVNIKNQFIHKIISNLHSIFSEYIPRTRPYRYKRNNGRRQSFYQWF